MWGGGGTPNEDQVYMCAPWDKEKFSPGYRQNWKNLEISFLKTKTFAIFDKIKPVSEIIFF